MLTVTLYTRKDCHLCDQAKADLVAIRAEIPYRLVEIDVDTNPALQSSMGTEVPVVEAGPYRVKAPFTRQDLMMTIGAANDRQAQLEKVGDDAYLDRVRRGQTVSGSDKFMYWISRHYLALINIFMLFYFGLPFVAPTLMETGATLPARAIYLMYSPLCHQFGFRSFFLYGEQPVYPHEAAHVNGLQTFEQVTGITDQNDPTRLQARRYVGDQTVGYKVALCERDVAIYFAMFAFGLLYAATGRKLKPLHWTLWILLGMGPIGLDGFSQLFSQLNLPFLATILPYRESTPFLRIFTGFMFGFMTAWFAYPYLEETMRENIQFFVKKIAVAQAAD
jgi:uncharacterized membrane protein